MEIVKTENEFISLNLIKERQEKLAEASRKLKEYFVGTEESIDKIIASITSWYCMPEILTRPTIVCLWGLTGVGKTDLVRKLISHLDLKDSFVEIQLSNQGAANHYESSIQSLLTSSNLETENPGVLLLDEFQRFRSVDEQGKDISDYKFQDLWMLLSDGNFGSNSKLKDQLLEIIYRNMYYDQVLIDEGKEKPEPSKYKYKQSFWEAKSIKKMLSLSEPFEEIMTWDTEKKVQVVTEKMEDKTAYKDKIYKKMLIFISGNIDEAYRMAEATGEVAIDADWFYEQSKKINILKIKEALLARFKPEQIARLGNCHVIYPSLTRKSYEEIISRKVGEVVSQVKNQTGVTIKVDESIYEALYRNAVFPVQGTRPVFSTISTFFESSLPGFIFEVLYNRLNYVELFYSEAHIRARIAGKEIALRVEGDIDKIVAENKNIDYSCKVSVHESGHAVVYALLFGYAPTQIAINAASTNKSGFINTHQIYGSKTQNLNLIKVQLAGRVAEELVFGNDNVGSGHSHDLEVATSIAANMSRSLGLYDNNSKLLNLGTNGHDSFNNNVRPTDETIENIITEQKRECMELLKTNAKLLIEVSKKLAEVDTMEISDFVKIFKDDGGIKIKVMDGKNTIYPSYEQMFDDFENKIRNPYNI